MFLEITSLVLVLVIALALLHLATGYLDIAYTTGRRYISPLEQHVHSYMEVLPLAATALLVVLFWDAFTPIFDAAAASWIFTRRQQPLPAAAIAAVAIGLGFAGLAIAEEYRRCSRRAHDARSRVGADRASPAAAAPGSRTPGAPR